VVNNGAAAVLLALAALGQGKAAVVSRGELVEIGGSFRIPDVMRASGVRLIEVGTTNRTHLHDYERALDEHADAALLLKVHRSNFAVVGFTAEVGTRDLAALAHRRGLRALCDLGSGALVDLGALGVPGGDAEDPVPEVVRSGVDLCTFSGDKLLGGPQAGILAGAAACVAACRTHPLLRALRPSKMTLAALEAVLELYRDGRAGEVPVVAMLTTPEPTLEARARRLAALCAEAAPKVAAEAARVRSAVGGGALPLCEPWSWAVAVTHPRRSPDDLDARLRSARPPVVARIAEDRLLLDVRTLSDQDLDRVASALGSAAKET
jgi:L-seryl-tRNA(Ser) seleniumtransferase